MFRLLSLIALLAALAGAVFAPAARAAALPRVLLLPAHDLTPDAKNMLAPRQAVVRHRLQFEFLSRRFPLLAENAATQAAATAPALALDAAARLPDASLDELGRRADADWVVQTAVEHVEASPNATGGLTIQSRVQLQIRDVRHHTWILDRDYTDETPVNGSPIMGFLQSLNAAVRTPLAAALADHPATVSLEGDGDLRDYLAAPAAPGSGPSS